MEIQSEVCIVVSQQVYLSTIQISSPDRRMGAAGMQPAFLEMTTHFCQELPGSGLHGFDRGAVSLFRTRGPGVGGEGLKTVLSTLVRYLCPYTPYTWYFPSVQVTQ